MHKDSELEECRRRVNEWKALAATWRNHAHALEDQIASMEAERLLDTAEDGD